MSVPPEALLFILELILLRKSDVFGTTIVVPLAKYPGAETPLSPKPMEAAGSTVRFILTLVQTGRLAFFSNSALGDTPYAFAILATDSSFLGVYSSAFSHIFAAGSLAPFLNLSLGSLLIISSIVSLCTSSPPPLNKFKTLS